MQAFAVSVDGQVTVRNITALAPLPAASASSAGSDGTGSSASAVKLIAAVDAFVPLMLLIQNDTTKEGFPTTRGYRLLDGSLALTTRTVQSDAFVPATSLVRVTLRLDPSGIYQVRSSLVAHCAMLSRAAILRVTPS